MKDINLLPEQKGEIESPDNETKKNNKKIIIVVIAIIIIASLLYIVPLGWLSISKKQVSSVKKELTTQKFTQIKESKTKLSDIDSKNTLKKEVIGDIEKNNYPFNEIFASMKRALPKNSTIASVDYKDGKLKVGGIAETGVAVGEFINNFQRLDSYVYLQNPIDYKTKGLKDNSSVIFEVSFALKGKEGK